MARGPRRFTRTRLGRVAAGIAGGVVAAVGMACGGHAKSTERTPQSTARTERPLAAGADSDRALRRSRGTVLVLGTSLTAGLGLDPDQAYPALLQKKIDSARLPFTVENAGLSGETSAGAVRRVGWLLRGPVDVFVLETGANDGLRGLDLDSTRAHVIQIIDTVTRARPNARIGLVQMEAPPNLGQRYTTAFHALYPAIAKAEGVTLLPFLLRGVAGRSALNQADGIHPNARGAQIVADSLWPGLEPLLRPAAPSDHVIGR